MRVTASLVVTSRPKARVAATMDSISSRSASILVRCSSSSIYSARSFSRVIGVRRSWPMAVSRNVRSSTKRRMREAMVLNATAAVAISIGPVSGRSGALATSRPRRSAARASVLTGIINWRTAQKISAAPSTVITMKAVPNSGERHGSGATMGEVMVSQICAGGRRSLNRRGKGGGSAGSSPSSAPPSGGRLRKRGKKLPFGMPKLTT